MTPQFLPRLPGGQIAPRRALGCRGPAAAV